jgi:hypothetical protein
VAEAVVHEAEGIQLFQRLEAVVGDLDLQIFLGPDIKALVVIRDGVGAMVARSLDDGEEWLLGDLQYIIGFAEQAEIGDSPDIDIR